MKAWGYGIRHTYYISERDNFLIAKIMFVYLYNNSFASYLEGKKHMESHCIKSFFVMAALKGRWVEMEVQRKYLHIIYCGWRHSDHNLSSVVNVIYRRRTPQHEWLMEQYFSFYTCFFSLLITCVLFYPLGRWRPNKNLNEEAFPVRRCSLIRGSVLEGDKGAYPSHLSKKIQVRGWPYVFLW